MVKTEKKVLEVKKEREVPMHLLFTLGFTLPTSFTYLTSRPSFTPLP